MQHTEFQGHADLPTLDLLELWAGTEVAHKISLCSEAAAISITGTSPEAWALPDPFCVCPRVVP